MRNIRGRIHKLFNRDIVSKDEIKKNALNCISLWLQGRKSEVTEEMETLYKLYDPPYENSIRARLKHMKEKC